MIGTYNLWLVALSVFVAMLASYTALSLASRVTAARERRDALVWRTGGAVSMGLGIWSMHFIGMLAFRLPIPMAYDTKVTLVSMLIAVLVSDFALSNVSHSNLSVGRLLRAGLLMGIGIAAMHYTGMAAMEMVPRPTYDPWLFVASVGIAITASTAALWIAFHLRSEGAASNIGYRLAAAVIMGLAIAGMHYTGMAAVEFDARSRCLSVAQTIDSTWLAVTVGVFAFVCLAVTLVVSTYDRWLRLGRERLEATRVTNEALDLKVRERTMNLLEANTQLQQEIAERERAQAALRIAKEEAEAASRAKSSFLANMSHEIRTPLNGVLGMAELLLGTPLNEKQRRFAETVHRSGEALLSIINDILDFSKIEAGKLELEVTDIDLRLLVEEVTELLADRAHKKGLEIACLIDAEIPLALRGDPGRLRQIITNLVGNAIKFTERGEVVVRVTCLGQTEDSVQIRCEVRDTGIGLTAEARQRLFQPFSQADSSTTRKYGGTGLGLTISKQLVEIMGGSIGVESEPGKGSVFWFSETLPVSATQPQHTDGREILLKGKRVLVVDDNETNRVILHYQLQSWGMHDEAVANGLDALELLRRAVRQGRPFDLAILDLHMPGMDGLTLAQLIKGDADIAKIHLSMLTSVGLRGDEEAVRAAGVEVYISKPVRQLELCRGLTGLMAVHNETQDRQPSQAVTGDLDHGTKTAILNARVLLVEDNPVNQEVALAMLEILGCQTEVAENGHAAIEAMQCNTYDLVLMDCQMPEMDGFTATQEIRCNEGSTRSTPIIALTANAIEGDREKCLDSGMNDYLSKPFTQDQLQAMLQRWVGANRKIAKSAQTERPDDIEQLRKSA
ncbi:MAG: MHYT domain-containing protein [Burkholderiales bacterium]